ncbi:hypothetical protein IX308_000102 [Porphyromonas levii]|uniref:DUF5689 domain-containing protein n=1 Tax=Porphyromonas levii TaxID=28114 RepID=UPI0020113917|nr:DUF5689 domain-containing protein [Porphyromonas levii]MBR8783944.1 hypothetical protein [Porphyromonas levii]
MKLSRLSLISLAALLGLGFASCERKYDAPLLADPTVTPGDEKVITIAEYKDKFKKVPKEGQIIEDNLAIRAVVVGNDVSGNIYKQIYVQDATGGISIGIDQNNISNDYQVGQEVFIKLQGLAATSYGGVTQIGMKDTQSNRIPYEVVKKQILRDKRPDAEKAKPKTTTIAQFSDNMVGTLIKLENVYFELGGTATYGDQAQNAVNRTLKDTTGKKLIVRNSKYASFANDVLPKGNGTVVGILSKFNKDYQLFIRTADDCSGFTGKDPITGGEVNPNPPAGNVIYAETFAADMGKMTAVSILGNEVWKVDTKYKNVSMSGFNGGKNNPNEDWLISPAFDLSAAKNAVLSFDHTISQGKGKTVELAKMKVEQTIWVSSDYKGDVTKATWTQVTIPNYPTGKDWNAVKSGDIAFPDKMMGQTNVVVAFKYLSSAEHSSTWQLKNLKVTSEGGKLAAGGTEPAPQPKPDPQPDPTPGALLFPGSDFNDWNAFLGSLNTYGLKFGKQSATGGIDGSGALQLSGTTDTQNGYIFTAKVPKGIDMKKVKKITFYIKGKSDKSLSINVFNTNPKITYYDSKTKERKPAGYVNYNLGDVNGAKQITGVTKNDYKGTINVGNWTKITLDLTALINGQLMTLPTEVGKDLISFKYGSKSAYDLYIDNISFE